MAGVDIAGGYGQIDPVLTLLSLYNQGQQLDQSAMDSSGYISNSLWDRLYGNGPLHNTLARDQFGALYGGTMPNGNPTLQAKLQDATLTGMYNNSPTMQKQLQDAEQLGTYNGQDTLAKQKYQTDAAQAYLNLMSQMGQRPDDYFQYQNVLRAGQATPMASWADRLRSGDAMQAFGSVGQSQSNQMATLGNPAPTSGYQTAPAQNSPNASWQMGSWQAPHANSMQTPDATRVNFTTQGMVNDPNAQARAYIDPTQTWGHQMNVRAYNKMSTAERGLTNSALKQQGYDSQDFWNAFDKAKPQGQASVYSSWR